MRDPDREGAARRRRFEETALPHMSSVYRVARRLSRRPDEASDLTQETFLRAYRTFDNFTPGTNCKAWLFTILYSVFINSYRRNQREPDWAPLEALDQGGARLLSGELADPEWEALRAADLHGWSPEVKRSIEGLPEAFRAAILLVDVEECSYEEAAAALGCPVGTLRSRLFRARRQLFRALRDYARRTGHVKIRKTP